MDKAQLLDDLSKFAGSAAGTLNTLRRQISDEARARVDDLAARMDLVPREDFDRLETMVRELEARVKTLESHKNSNKKAEKAPSTSKAKAKPEAKAKPVKPAAKKADK